MARFPMKDFLTFMSIVTAIMCFCGAPVVSRIYHGSYVDIDIFNTTIVSSEIESITCMKCFSRDHDNTCDGPFTCYTVIIHFETDTNIHPKYTCNISNTYSQYDDALNNLKLYSINSVKLMGKNIKSHMCYEEYELPNSRYNDIRLIILLNIIWIAIACWAIYTYYTYDGREIKPFF